jgi:hypothetical protein
MRFDNRPTDRQPEPQTARFRDAAIRAVFDKRSTLCLRKMTTYVPKWCERRPRGGRNRHVRLLLGTGLV